MTPDAGQQLWQQVTWRGLPVEYRGELPSPGSIRQGVIWTGFSTAVVPLAELRVLRDVETGLL